jgi:hypothetical protein
MAMISSHLSRRQCDGLRSMLTGRWRRPDSMVLQVRRGCRLGGLAVA